MFGIQNGQVKFSDAYMYYTSFGRGIKPLVMLPGLSTRGVKGAEISLFWMYRIFSKQYKVYFFDRINPVPKVYSIENMADDTVLSMKELKIEKAAVFGVSMGGMIAQSIAAKYPEMVDKLILAVTSSRPNETINSVVSKWIKYAEAEDYISLNRDVFSKMYSDNYLKKNRFLLPVAERLAKPDDLSKFMICANACLHFDGYNSLNHIQCPVMVLGGKKDKVVTGKASEEIAEKIKCDIFMYDELGHAAYDEAKDFNQRIYDFLER